MFRTALTRRTTTKPSGFTPSQGMRGLLGGEDDQSPFMAARMLKSLNQELVEVREKLVEVREELQKCQSELMVTESQRAIAMANLASEQTRLTLSNEAYTKLQAEKERIQKELRMKKEELEQKTLAYMSRGETIASLTQQIAHMVLAGEKQAKATALAEEAHIEELTRRDAKDRQERAADLKWRNDRISQFQSLNAEKEMQASQAKAYATQLDEKDTVLARQAEAHAVELAKKDEQLEAQAKEHASFVQELIRQFFLSQQN